MHITRLVLRNIRCFEQIELTDLSGDLVLVSPNGAGNSTILEVIAGVQQIVQPYHRENYEFSGSEGREWPVHLRPPLRLGEKQGEITLTVKANETESEFLNSRNRIGDEGTTTVMVGQDRRIISIRSDSVSKELFSFHRSSEGIGRVDQIRATRQVPPTTLINSVSQIREDRERVVFSEFNLRPNETNKFNDLTVR